MKIDGNILGQVGEVLSGPAGSLAMTALGPMGALVGVAGAAASIAGAVMEGAKAEEETQKAAERREEREQLEAMREADEYEDGAKLAIEMKFGVGGDYGGGW